jgi:hypothetical protein
LEALEKLGKSLETLETMTSGCHSVSLDLEATCIDKMAAHQSALHAGCQAFESLIARFPDRFASPSPCRWREREPTWATIFHEALLVDQRASAIPSFVRTASPPDGRAGARRLLIADEVIDVFLPVLYFAVQNR